MKAHLSLEEQALRGGTLSISSMLGQQMAHKAIQFDPPDIDDLLQDFDPIGQGKKSGRSGLPRADAVHPDADAAESSLRSGITKTVNDQITRFRDQVIGYKDQVQKIDLVPKLNEIRNISDKCERDIQSITHKGKAALREMIDRRNILMDELEEFRRRNSKNLRGRSAIYPLSKAFLIGVILFILMAEVGLNSYFFTLGSDYGIAEGAVQAFLVALVNVAISFLFGRLSTWINAVSLPAKALGFTSIVFLFTWVVLYNLGVGHYREFILAGSSSPTEQVFLSFGNLLFESFQSPDTYLLFLLGVVFGLVAAADGWFWDDRCPGYGAATRRFEEARQDLADELEETSRDLGALKDDNFVRLDRLFSDIDAECAYLANVVTIHESNLSAFEHYMEQWDERMVAVIARYREENQRARGELPTPAYFGDRPSVNARRSLTESEKRFDVEKVRLQEAHRAAAVPLLEETKNKLLDLYNKALGEINEMSSNNYTI